MKILLVNKCHHVCGGAEQQRAPETHHELIAAAHVARGARAKGWS